MMNRRAFVTSLLSPLALRCGPAGSVAPPQAPERSAPLGVNSEPLASERARAALAMRRAARFLIEHASHQGGYLWAYRADLSRCWGEPEARRTMLWVQPPGTPSVGQLWLDAFHASGDSFYLDAAEQTARADQRPAPERRLELRVRLSGRSLVARVVRDVRAKRLAHGRVQPRARQRHVR